MRKHFFAVALGSLMCWVVSGPVSAAVIFVRQGATGANNGTSWPDAFTDLQSALAVAASGDEVWAAKGTYHPGQVGQTSATYAVPSGVRVFGGFVGTEATKVGRNWRLNQTVLSGDLADDDVFGNPWWNGWNTNTPNSKNVVTLVGTANGTLLDGLVVSNGNAVQTSGGAIAASGSVFEVRNCMFRRNSGYQGAGSCLFVNDGFVTVRGCEFLENWGRFVSGVGIATAGAAGADVADCVFTDNHAESDASSGNGAGIALQGSTPSSVTHCTFRYNFAQPFFSAYPSYGGGVFSLFAPLQIDRCAFEHNESVMGGGVFSFRDLTVSNCLFNDNRVFATANGGGFGGAIATYYYGAYTLRVVGCTIVKNRAHETAGVSANGTGSFTADVANCIFWGNVDINGTVSQTSVKKARNSCVENLWVTIPGEDPIDPAKFPNCFDSNPKFRAYPTDLHLQLASPCVDAGDKTAFDGTWTLDLDDLWRFMDVPTAPDTGIGAAPLPDMGCFEAASGKHLGRRGPVGALRPH